MRSAKIWKISLPTDMAMAVEKTAKAEARATSELIQDALRQCLWKRQWVTLRQYGEQKAKEFGLQESDRLDAWLREQTRPTNLLERKFH